jgi:hypothetical protein
MCKNPPNSILGDLEAALSDLFAARVITYTTVLAANMSALPLIASGHLTGGVRPVMVFDRLAHATLAFHNGTIAAETRVETIAHNDLDALESLCHGNTCVAYICDGVYSMGGSASIEELRRSARVFGVAQRRSYWRSLCVAGIASYEGTCRSSADSPKQDRPVRQSRSNRAEGFPLTHPDGGDGR